jgi:predicted transcriptional regulator
MFYKAFKKGSKLIEPSRHVSQALVDLQKEVQRSIDPDKVAEMVAYLHAAISNKIILLREKIFVLERLLLD